MPARDSKGRFVKKEVATKVQKPLRDAKGRFVKKTDAAADTFEDEVKKDFDAIFDDIKKAIDDIKSILKSFDK